MNTTQKAILLAYEKGYRVTDEGVLVGIKGGPLNVKLRGNQKYPTFSLSGVKGPGKNKYGVYGVPVHQFAAYCFYGEQAFDAECIRHLDGDTTNVARENIVLGTHSQNNMDKASDIRSAAARKARATQGKRPINARFTDEQVRYIRSSWPDKNYAELAKEFDVTKQAIYLIVKKQNYRDVT